MNQRRMVRSITVHIVDKYWTRSAFITVYFVDNFWTRAELHREKKRLDEMDVRGSLNKFPDFFFVDSTVTRKVYFYPRTGFYFRTCEDGTGWHLIPYRISPRSEFFSQAYKNWHIMWGINLGPDWPPLARGSKFHTIHTPTRSLNFLP